DQDDAAPEVVYQVVAPPQHGALERGGVFLNAGDSFTQMEVDQGQLSYVNNGAEAATDAFTFTVADSFGVGVPATSFTLHVAPVDDPPTLINNDSLTVARGGVAAITTDLLQVTDPDQGPEAVR